MALAHAAWALRTSSSVRAGTIISVEAGASDVEQIDMASRESQKLLC